MKQYECSRCDKLVDEDKIIGDDDPICEECLRFVDGMYQDQNIDRLIDERF